MGRQHVEAYRHLGITPVRGQADIVSIASPDNTHGKYVIDALDAGAHVFCEKPLCTTLRDFKEIYKRAGKKHIRQNFPLRYQPIFKDLKNNLESFGDIYRIEASYNWGRTQKLNETWRKTDPEYSLVMGGMIHMIDLVLWMTGLDMDPMKVLGCNMSAPAFKGPDTVTALCKMSNGGICVFTVYGGKGVSRHNHRLTLHGTKRGRTVANHEPTDKQAAIRDFVKNIYAPPTHDLESVAMALEIDQWV